VSRFKGLVLTGFGINCDLETAHALELAGFKAERVHINDLIAGRAVLGDFHLLVFDGGFSWGDDHGASVLLAHRMKANFGQELGRFVASGRLIMGICNGFQALVNLGLLPAFEGRMERKVALVANDCGVFRDDWVRLSFTPDSPSVFTKGIDCMDLPIRHGEGKLYAPAGTIDRIEQENLVAARYALADGRPAEGRFPENPNGSINDIAALSDPSGRVLGLMPHPEAFHHLTNHPDWSRRADRARRKGEQIDWAGEGLKLFNNALDYLKAET